MTARRRQLGFADTVLATIRGAAIFGAVATVLTIAIAVLYLLAHEVLGLI